LNQLFFTTLFHIIVVVVVIIIIIIIIIISVGIVRSRTQTTELKLKVIIIIEALQLLSWLRKYATSWKVVGLSSDEVTDFFFQFKNPSSRAKTLGLTQPLT
jgi:hypothetical protein